MSIALLRSPLMLATNWPIETLNSSTLQERYTQVALQKQFELDKFKLNNMSTSVLTKFPSGGNPWTNCSGRTVWNNGTLFRRRILALEARTVCRIPSAEARTVWAKAVPRPMIGRKLLFVLPKKVYTVTLPKLNFITIQDTYRHPDSMPGNEIVVLFQPEFRQFLFAFESPIFFLRTLRIHFAGAYV